ncbi:MAG: alpha/beta hydrolase [Ktedonobacterales bacterium]|nr:alpha/beta hydrolase [Ktedonobacterales bacterium]
MALQATAAQWERLRSAEATLLAHIPVSITAHDIAIAGEQIHYLEAGDAKLPPLVLVHGRGSAAALWGPILPQLAAHRHVFAVDMRGWGLSSRTPFTGTGGAEAIAWWRDGVLGVVDALGLTRFDLIGHSLGGMVSLSIALARGSQIDHLLLEDAAGFATTSPLDTRLYFALEPERVAPLLPRPLFNIAARGSVNIPNLTPAAKAAYADFVYTLTTFPGTRASGARGFNTILGVEGVRYTLLDQVHNVTPFTRAFWGVKDGVVPLNTSKAGIEMLPHGELVTFPNAMHSPHMEVPDVFARAALEFLARGIETPVNATPASAAE